MNKQQATTYAIVIDADPINTNGRRLVSDGLIVENLTRGGKNDTLIARTGVHNTDVITRSTTQFRCSAANLEGANTARR